MAIAPEPSKEQAMQLGRFLVPLLISAMSLPIVVGSETLRPASSDDAPETLQQREDDAERVWAALLDQCKAMLDQQLAIHAGIQDLNKVIADTAARKPRPEDRKAGLKLADQQRKIIQEVTRVIELMEKPEARAVAFPEVFRQLREDMRRVHQCLVNCDVGRETQAVEEDVVETLREIIKSFNSR
jgi:hypothetical protein